MNKFKELSKDIDFILFLGDMPAHSLLFNRHKAEYEKIVFHNLYQNDSSSKPMFYIAGNNDSLLGNYQAFERNGISPLTYASEWSGACAHCQDLIIDGSHMHHDGYYSSYVIPKNKEIILLALNATQWTQISGLKKAFFPKYTHQEEDALAQLTWFEHQLKQHKAKQLLIALHEPPGNSYLGEPIWYTHYLQKFIALLAQYHHLYGEITLISSHTHMDEFRRINLGKGINIYAYSVPSISRHHHNYPGMKIFNLDDNFKIKDFTTYYTSHLHRWENQQYHALSIPDTIFPGCQTKTLAQCLNQLSVDKVCDHIEKGLFYGVKNPKVLDLACKKTYPVN
jgi:alkaline phosphatase D